MKARSKNMDLFGPGGCLTRNAIKQHLEGNLNEDEARKVKRHAKRCELCSSALEGALLLEGQMKFNAALSKLDNSPWRKSLNSDSKNRKIMFGVSSIAASFLLLFGVFYTLKMREQISGLPKVIMSEETIKTHTEIQDSIGSGSLFLNGRADNQELKNEINTQKLNSENEGLTFYDNIELETEETTPFSEKEKKINIQHEVEQVVVQLSETEEKNSKQNEPIIEESESFTNKNNNLGYKNKTNPEGQKQKHSILRRDKKTYIVAEVMPLFRGGGIEKFNAYLVDSLKVSMLDSEHKESIVIGFKINSIGKVGNVKLIRGTSSKELNEKIIHLVKESPLWVPGMTNGMPVTVEQQLELVLNNSRK